MINLTCKVVGVNEVVANIGNMSSRIHARVRQAVEKSGIELQAGVKSSRLTGQSLNVRSGRLRRSITQQTEDDGQLIVSTTGTNVVYGRFWELGFKGVEQVKGHHRRIFRATKSGRRGKVTNIAWVRPHSRNTNQAPRAFLQPELDARRLKILDRIKSAIYAKDK